MLFRNRSSLALLFCVLFAGCPELKPVPGPAPSPDNRPANTFGFEQSIPPTMDDRAEAIQLAAVCDEYAKQIAFDGTRTSPAVGTTADVMQRSKKMTEYAFGGHPIATDDLAKLIAKTLDQQLEPDGKAHPMTPELRQKTSDVFKAIAYGLRQVK